MISMHQIHCIQWVSLNMLHKEFIFPELFPISSYLFPILYLRICFHFSESSTLLSSNWIHFLDFIGFLQFIKITLNSSPLFSSVLVVLTWVSAVHANFGVFSSLKLVLKVLTRTGFRTDFLVRQWTSAN